MIRTLHSAIFVVMALFLAGPSACLAESLMFMDESGNIHFVSSLNQIPEKYKSQVVKPAPVVQGKGQGAKKVEVMLKKREKELARKQKAAKKKKAKEERKRAKEKKRANKLKDREKKKMRRATGGAIEDVG